MHESAVPMGIGGASAWSSEADSPAAEAARNRRRVSGIIGSCLVHDDGDKCRLRYFFFFLPFVISYSLMTSRGGLLFNKRRFGSDSITLTSAGLRRSQDNVCSGNSDRIFGSASKPLARR